MQAGNLVAVLFVLLMMIMAGVYASRRNNPNAHIMAKQLNGSEASDITESEPELEVKEKEVDKMDLIPEEEDEKDVVNDLNNKDNKNKNKKDNAENEDNETKSGDESDSEEYSMQRMVEEYQKSRTLAKKFAEIIEDISDTFKRKSIEIKRKFEPEAPPAVIRPMSMKEKLEQLNKANNDKKNNSKNNGNKKNKKNKDKQSQNKQDDNDIHFDVNFDDEKQQEMDEMDELVQKEKKEYIDNMDMEDIDNMDTNNDVNEDMVDSEDEFGEFNANNFEDFEDFDTEKIENNNGAIEIVTKKEEKLGGDENIEYVEDKNEKFNNEAIEISMEDEKVVEVEQLANNEPIAED